MCIVREAGSHPSEGLSDQAMNLDVDALLGDIAVGLELSRKLRALADGPWKECDRSGRLPLRGILRECAQRIVTEAKRCRRELEADGKINFGRVVVEEDGDSYEPDPAIASRWSDRPALASDLRSSSARSPSGSLLAQAVVHSREIEPLSLGPIRRVLAAILTKPAPEEPRWSAVEPRQGGT